MNIKINKELHEQLCKLEYKEYLFGSQLHGIANENSDYDYIRVISDDLEDYEVHPFINQIMLGIEESIFKFEKHKIYGKRK